MSFKEFKFPKDFKMGTSVASVMVEGGNDKTNWYSWSEEGHIKDGSHVMRGTDHWNKYLEDIQLMKELNNDSYCMSIEWSRVEVKKGVFDEAAIEHYRSEIKALLDNGIHPMLTLHHFSNPQWFDDMDGWENKESRAIFTNYVEYVVSKLGDLVSDWITFNDENITLISGYLWAWFPPGKTSYRSMMRAMKNIVHSHIESYKIIHKVRSQAGYKGKTNVGISSHFRIYDPDDQGILSKIGAKAAQYFSIDLVLHAMATGKFRYPIGLGGYPAGKGKFYDFMGINYWTRNTVKFSLNPRNLFCQLRVDKKAEKTDGGWEIYPQGLSDICHKYYQRYNAPLYIVQNGLREPVDNQRTSVIYENLKQVAKLIKEGIPVERFYIWTLIDIFECHEGENAKLGIVKNNFETQERTIKKSGKFYRDVCENKEVTQEIYDKYLGN